METLGLSRQPGKEIADEDIDGFDVQFQIGPLQGPLPAVPEEGRRRGAVQFRGYFSSLLGTFEAARENILPLREDGGKLLAEVFRSRRGPAFPGSAVCCRVAWAGGHGLWRLARDFAWMIFRLICL